MSNELAPLTPAFVMCCQQSIMAVRLPDGFIAATPHSFCDALQLDRTAQLRRIRRNEFLARHLRSVPIRTKGGVQIMDVLIIKALPRWLSTLQISRLAPEKQRLARALQQQAEEALERHFAEEAPSEAAPPPPNPSAEPPRSPRKMAHKAFERLHQAADVLSQAAEALRQAGDAIHGAAGELNEIYMVSQEQDEALGDHIVVLESDVAALKQGQVSKAEAKPRQPLPQDGPILTAEHCNQVYALARHLRGQTGVSIAALLAELAESFGVEDMSDIPDAGWEQVKAWFWLRTQRPNTN
jgi:hypothetical protein